MDLVVVLVPTVRPIGRLLGLLFEASRPREWDVGPREDRRSWSGAWGGLFEGSDTTLGGGPDRSCLRALFGAFRSELAGSGQRACSWVSSGVASWGIFGVARVDSRLAKVPSLIKTEKELEIPRRSVPNWACCSARRASRRRRRCQRSWWRRSRGRGGSGCWCRRCWAGRSRGGLYARYSARQRHL